MSKGKDLDALNLIERRAWELLQVKETLSSGELASAANVTRQAAHLHLRRMGLMGLVEREGAGRTTRYRRKADFFGSWDIGGLQEDVVWSEVVADLQAFKTARDNVRRILHYSLTEMVNNAIDHSGGSKVRVTAWASEEEFTFEVSDDGVGVFAHVRDRFGLDDLYAAIEEVSKGKQTTDPQRHSGEGIFFTSKAVDRFDLTSNGLRWLVDNAKSDEAIGDAVARKGTLVRCSIARSSKRDLRSVFASFADEDRGFVRSRVSLRLFDRGSEFVSRSEAKRLAASLDEFREVEVDFAGVSIVGQGFCDELFRVWARAHPETELIPTNMSETVRRQVDRARTNPS
jgi:anti-sigma regulatory factor (Ser/Thr protein kinase)